MGSIEVKLTSEAGEVDDCIFSRYKVVAYSKKCVSLHLKGYGTWQGVAVFYT